MNFLSVGAGGFLGACLRYFLSRRLSPLADFPYGTLLSNVIAAFLIGLIIGLERRSALDPTAKLFLTTGLLGGLSTFSTFSLETVSYLETGHYLLAVSNVGLNVGLCLLFVFAGLALIRLVPAGA
ncbi:putative fluoride ion transporter CrcB [bioreactor metagenome]|uniref:Putative fluoride ion transporter CrcB n=1 Tax=bioreactor metagenome TaxID=1076179 RepID=A0A645BSB4_9ZZZZ